MKGIHLPNRETTNQELSRIVALGCTDYVDLNLWPWRWKTLKSLQPKCRIHVRIYQRGTLTPNDDARACATLIKDYPEIDTVRIRNEPNIETPFLTPDLWEKYLDTMLSVYNDDKLSLPAISPGLHGWDTYVSINADLARKYNMKYLDAHIYGNIGEFEDTLYTVENLWQGNLLITEHNFGAGRDYKDSQWAQDYCNIIKLFQYHTNIKLFSEFIWEWCNPDRVLVTPINIKDSIMERTIMGAIFPIVFDEGPVQTPLNISEQRAIELKVLPEWYLACIKAGEDWTLKTTIDFVSHLKGIGADWQHPELYGWK